MSTRATYKIVERTNKGTEVNTFYIHCDGYAAGAAEYFQHMLKFRNETLIKMYEKSYRPERYINNKSWASIFEIAIPSAEKTVSHDFHGDTEYQYSLYFSKDCNFIEARQVGNDIFFTGSLEEFISTERLQYNEGDKQ